MLQQKDRLGVRSVWNTQVVTQTDTDSVFHLSGTSYQNVFRFFVWDFVALGKIRKASYKQEDKKRAPVACGPVYSAHYT